SRWLIYYSKYFAIPADVEAAGRIRYASEAVTLSGGSDQDAARAQCGLGGVTGLDSELARQKDETLVRRVRVSGQVVSRGVTNEEVHGAGLGVLKQKDAVGSVFRVMGPFGLSEVRNDYRLGRRIRQSGKNGGKAYA